MLKSTLLLFIFVAYTSSFLFAQDVNLKSESELIKMKKEAIANEDYVLAKKITQELKLRKPDEKKLEDLKKQLEDAINKEDYLTAKKLKNEITVLEEKYAEIHKLNNRFEAELAANNFMDAAKTRQQIIDLNSPKVKQLKEEKTVEPKEDVIVSKTDNNTETNNNYSATDDGIENFHDRKKRVVNFKFGLGIFRMTDGSAYFFRLDPSVEFELGWPESRWSGSVRLSGYNYGGGAGDRTMWFGDELGIYYNFSKNSEKKHGKLTPYITARLGIGIFQANYYSESYIDFCGGFGAGIKVRKFYAEFGVFTGSNLTIGMAF